MSTSNNPANADPAELAKFGELAHRWWDPQSEFRPLHEINPLRLDWIESLAPLAGRDVLDVGCGGGILAEAMARRGARVTGIDLREKALKVAQLHLLESGQPVHYELASAEDLRRAARRRPSTSSPAWSCSSTCPSPRARSPLARACCGPGGRVFFSTINRNPKSYLFAVIGAEYVLKLLPRGTHDYARFVRRRSWRAGAALPRCAQRR